MASEERKKKILSKVIKKFKTSDVGENLETGEVAFPSYEEQKVIYPRLHLNSEQLSVLSSYEAGDEIIMVAKGEVKNVEKFETEDDKRENYEVEIQEIGCPKKEEEDDDIDEEEY